MGRQADLCWMLGAPEKVQCVECGESFNTYFDDYDIDGGECCPEQGLWVLLTNCPYCEADMTLRYRVKLQSLEDTTEEEPKKAAVLRPEEILQRVATLRALAEEQQLSRESLRRLVSDAIFEGTEGVRLDATREEQRSLLALLEM